MLNIELPQELHDEFERSAHLLYDSDGVKRALIEAIELWLAQRQAQLIEAEKTANARAYERLKPELERDHWGQWIVIAHGDLQGMGACLEDVEPLAPSAHARIVMQVGEERPKEIELGWQLTFG